MKRNYYALVLAVLSVVTACTQAPESDSAKTGDAQEENQATGQTYRVDQSASEVVWIGTKVTGYHVGEVQVDSGALIIKQGNIAGGNFNLDMTSITTTGPSTSQKEWDDKLTEHLKSGDFFDVTNYPNATFVITDVKPHTGTVSEENDPRQEDINKYKVTNPTHIVSGNLTLKNVTKNIQFPARVTITGNTVEAVAKFNIDRKQWELTYPGKPDDLIRDEIHLGISLVARK